MERIMTNERLEELFGKICFRTKYTVVRAKQIHTVVEIVVHRIDEFGNEIVPPQGYVPGKDNLSYQELEPDLSYNKYVKGKGWLKK